MIGLVAKSNDSLTTIEMYYYISILLLILILYNSIKLQILI